MNIVQVEGALTRSPELERRNGRLKLSFRLAVPRADALPSKHGNNADFVTVARYGESRLENLLIHLDHAHPLRHRPQAGGPGVAQSVSG